MTHSLSPGSLRDPEYHARPRPSRSDAEFLDWIAARLVHVHGESPNVDYLHRLHEVATRLETAGRVLPFSEMAGPPDDYPEPEPLRSGAVIAWGAGAMVVAALLILWLVTR
jgi:hypothetical protein